MALQQQSAALGPQRSAELSALLEAEDAVNNLQNELNHNAAYLTDLKRQISTVKGKIDATNKEIAYQRALLDEMTRGQYKTLSSDDQLALIFSSQSFGDLLNNIMASATINRRIGDTARKLKAQEADLSTLSADLGSKQTATQQVQAQLAQENAKELALVAQHDANVAKLDSDQQALLGQIASVNKQIAIAQTPPPPRFSAATFASGGGGPPVSGGGPRSTAVARAATTSPTATAPGTWPTGAASPGLATPTSGTPTPRPTATRRVARHARVRWRSGTPVPGMAASATSPTWRAWMLADSPSPR